jgi:hypothetical protein
LAPLPPVIEEDNVIGVGLVGSDGDALGRGSALMELKRGEGGSLEPVGDGADMLHSSDFSGHDYPLSTHFIVSIFTMKPMDAEKRPVP